MKNLDLNQTDLRTLLRENDILVSKSLLSKALNGRKGASLERLLDIRELLESRVMDTEKSVKETGWIRRKVYWAEGADPISKVIEVMNEKDYSQIPVREDGKMIGVITNDDIRKKCMMMPPSTPARNLVSGAVRVPLDAKAKSVILWVKKYGYVLVEDRGDIVGIVTYSDCLEDKKKRIS